MSTWLPGGIEWGAYSGQIRVGIKVDREDQILHGEGSCRFEVTYYTQNNVKINSDPMALNLGGAITDQIQFTNDQGTGVVQRNGTKVYTYSYGPNEYGSSPGTKTFTATLGGYAGGTPSKNNSVQIPARPYGAPSAPFFQSASWNSDSQITVQWAQAPTSGEPWSAVYVDRYIYGVQDWTRVANLGATGATSGAIATGFQGNWKATYRIFSGNVAGYSGAVQTNDVWSSPAAPSGFTRTQISGGTIQRLTWANQVGYPEYVTQLWYQVNGGAWTALPNQGAGVTSFDHSGLSPANRYAYRICATATQIALSSGLVYSDESSGSTSAPNPPSALAPGGDVSVDPKTPIALTWTHNPTDTTEQTQYELQHRELGTGTWFATSPPVQPAVGKSYTLVPDSYDYTKHVEWRVRTWGFNTSLPSAYTTAAFWTMDEIPVKYPLVINLTTGRVEALSGGGVAGVGDANAYYYEQNYTTATSSVGLSHGLGTKGLEIEFYDGTGVQRFGDVTKTADTITMTFAHPMTGLMIVYGAVAA
jgi:hypothetical protein